MDAVTVESAIVASDLLVIRDMSLDFPLPSGLFGLGPARVVHAVQKVSFSVPQGSCFAIVGESGSGKTSLARTLVGLEKPTSGEVLVDGISVGELDDRAVRKLRRRVQMVLQDPRAAIDPRLSVYQVLREALIVHDITRDKAEQRRRIEAVIQRVGLSLEHLARYANELSGGQRQRVAIARAIIVEPQILILDEPVSALDVSIQAQIVNLLIELQEQLGLTYVLITHDLSLVGHMADGIGVMYLGRLVEQGPAAGIIANPSHPYTQSLLSVVASEDPDEEKGREVTLLEGTIPSPLALPSGCAFHTRCPHARALAGSLDARSVAEDEGRPLPRRCIEVAPVSEPVPDAGGRRVACHYALTAG